MLFYTSQNSRWRLKLFLIHLAVLVVAVGMAVVVVVAYLYYSIFLARVKNRCVFSLAVFSLPAAPRKNNTKKEHEPQEEKGKDERQPYIISFLCIVILKYNNTLFISGYRYFNSVFLSGYILYTDYSRIQWVPTFSKPIIVIYFITLVEKLC